MTPTALLVLFRSFLEISIWSAKLSAANPQPGQTASHLLKLLPILPKLEIVMGSDTIPSRNINPKDGPGPGDWQNIEAFDTHYKILGVTPETSDELVVAAYDLQMACDTNKKMWYLESLKEIQTLRGDKNEIALRVVTEESKGKHAWSEIDQALKTIGCTLISTGEFFFSFPIYNDPSDEAIVRAYADTRERIITTNGTEGDMKALRHAIRIVLDIQPSDFIKATVESLDPEKPKAPAFTEDEAYVHLGIGKDLDDYTICNAGFFWVCRRSVFPLDQ